VEEQDLVMVLAVEEEVTMRTLLVMELPAGEVLVELVMIMITPQAEEVLEQLAK